MSHLINPEEKIYHLENRKSNYTWMTILAAIAIVYLARIIFSAAEWETPIYTKLFVFLIAILFVWYFYYQGRYVRLILSKTGVAYHGLGYSLQATWDQVERIGPVPDLAKPIDDGLILRQANLTKRWWFSMVKPAIWRDNYISLLMFDRQWRQNEIGQVIKSCAPHLFPK